MARDNSKKPKLSIDNLEFSETDSDSEDDDLLYSNDNDEDQSIGNNKEISISSNNFDTNLSFKNIGGLDDIKKTLIVSVINKFMPNKYSCTVGHKGLGVVFYGPPGTGKTFMAKCLVAELNRNLSSRVSLYTITGDQKSKYYGESEKIIKQTFQMARENAPSVVLLDEMESIGSSREFHKEDANSSIVAQLLVEIQNLESSKGQVLVIGITNMLQRIDPALLRPGRLGQKIQFLPPTGTGRLEILKGITSHWKKNKRPNEEIIESIVKHTNGFTGADLNSLVERVVDKSLNRAFDKNVNNVSSALAALKRHKFEISAEDWLSEAKKMKPTNISCFDSCLYIPRPLCPKLATALFSEIEREIMEKTPDWKNIKNDKAIKPLLVWGQKNEDIDLFILPTVMNNLLNRFVLYSVNRQHILAGDNSKAEILCNSLNQSMSCGQPAVLYIPSIDKLWSGIPTLQKEHLQEIIHRAKNSQVAIIATSSVSPQAFRCPLLTKIFDCRVSVCVEIKDFTPRKISETFEHLFQRSFSKLVEMLESQRNKTKKDRPAGTSSMPIPTPTEQVLKLKEIFSAIEVAAPTMSTEHILELGAEIEEVTAQSFEQVGHFFESLDEVANRYNN